MKTSQNKRLYELLSDGEAHSTTEIQEKVYGSDHLGLARVGARVNDLKNGKWSGKTMCEIDGFDDENNQSVYWYQMIGVKKEPAPVVPQKKVYPNGQLFNINLL